MTEKLLNLLRKDFEKRKGVNPRYSVRAYAQYLEVSPASLSQVLSEKRKLTGKVKRNIIKKLEIDTTNQ